MSAWDSIKSLIGVVAPVLGTALGGPLGGVAASTLSSFLLGKPDGTEAEISAALGNMTPEVISKLKQAEMQYEAQKLRIEAADRKDARKREKDHRDKTGKGDPIMAFIAIVVVVGFFALLFSVIFLPMANGSDKVAYMMLGNVSAGFLCILQYYFGSSSGSSKKTDLIKSDFGALKELLTKIIK